MNTKNDQLFSKLPLSKAQLKNLASLGFDTMTPIQAGTIPPVLDGRDVIARAKTGSGKTAAFGLGLLEKIKPANFGVQVLVLCPTRELAEQVGGELRRLARCIPNIKLVLLCGGKPLGPQRASLEHGAHIAVGTPGRVKDLLDKRFLDLSRLKTLVLDEADRMLDMGFIDDMMSIVANTPPGRQTLLFSATYPDSMKQVKRKVLRNPVEVSVETEHEQGIIDQVFYEVEKNGANQALLDLLAHYRPPSALVFCQTRKQCAEVANHLKGRRISSQALHGDLEQADRERVLVQFANGSCPILVATDVAARGLDIKQLPMVINFELPTDPETYVHRIGRTGRAGEKGMALSIVTVRDHGRKKRLEEYLGTPCICDVPESLEPKPGYTLLASMVCIELSAGRKQKMRPGDILGALTGDAGLQGSDIGKIDIFDWRSFVAIKREAVRQAMNYFANGSIKGKTVKARKL